MMTLQIMTPVLKPFSGVAAVSTTAHDVGAPAEVLTAVPMASRAPR
jgi:hypothetical protein